MPDTNWTKQKAGKFALAGIGLILFLVLIILAPAIHRERKIKSRLAQALADVRAISAACRRYGADNCGISAPIDTSTLSHEN